MKSGAVLVSIAAHWQNECKQMRQELASWHTQEIRASRDTPQDPGTDLTHPKEEQRSSIEQLLQANLCRVEEALRVLEEYGKLYHPEMGAVFKQMRYRVIPWRAICWPIGVINSWSDRIFTW
jgi:thiamine-phosphate pyrophosphorylase